MSTSAMSSGIGPTAVAILVNEVVKILKTGT